VLVWSAVQPVMNSIHKFAVRQAVSVLLQSDVVITDGGLGKGDTEGVGGAALVNKAERTPVALKKHGIRVDEPANEAGVVPGEFAPVFGQEMLPIADSVTVALNVAMDW